jgi:small subunit ribosomal protein S4
MKLFLKGTRCFMAKCPVETGRAAPGVHGQRRGRRLSDYGTQLREKQRLRRQYGIREKQFRLFFSRAARRRGVTGDTLLQMLEMRLDNLVWRLGFAPSRPAARQFVRHGHVLVKGRKATIPSMTLSEGDVVQVADKPKSRELAKKGLELTESRELAPWLTLDSENFAGTVVRVPTRDEIAPIVNEQLIVELYSK